MTTRGPAAAESATRGQSDGLVWDGARRHVLDLDDFSREEIEHVLDSAEGMGEVLRRDVRKLPSLRGKTVITAFFESSTRTRVSFEQAGKVLGADVINFSASGSSVSKGESLLNTLLTLQAMRFDVLVMRHPHSGAPYFAASSLDVSIVNAGDGAHAHPTQALLDLYTMRSHLGNLRGKRVAIVGDILYSRVARSEIFGLLTMGAQVSVCAPPTLLPFGWTPGSVLPDESPFHGVRVERRVEEAIEGSDAVMALRIQKERQSAGHIPDLREYASRYGVNEERMKLANDDAIVMHPGPMNEGVEISPETAHGHRSVIQEQVNNGVAVRMAVLFALCNKAAALG